MNIHRILLDGKHGKPVSADIRYLETGEAKPLILFVHGFKGFKDWGTFDLIADFFTREGFVFAKMNFSHNGTTPDTPLDFSDLEAFGNNNFTKELDDLDTMISFLLSEENPVLAGECAADRFSLIGHSRGGSVVILKSAEDSRVRKVVSWSAVSDLTRQWAKQETRENWEKEGVYFIRNGRTGQDMPMYFQLYEDIHNNSERFDLNRAVGSLAKPLLAFHGTKDPVLPLQMGKDLQSWNEDMAELVIVPEADHTYGGYHPYDKEELPEKLQFVCEKTAAFLRTD